MTRNTAKIKFTLVSTHVHTGRKNHRRVINRSTCDSTTKRRRSKVVEDVTCHQRELGDLRQNDRNSSEVSADEPILAVQLVPASHPEEEVQKLRNERGEDVMGGECLNLARLIMILPPYDERDPS